MEFGTLCKTNDDNDDCGVDKTLLLSLFLSLLISRGEIKIVTKMALKSHT